MEVQIFKLYLMKFRVLAICGNYMVAIVNPGILN
jgi:hypothetical protein